MKTPERMDCNSKLRLGSVIDALLFFLKIDPH
jgi:hypothetical protein